MSFVDAWQRQNFEAITRSIAAKTSAHVRCALGRVGAGFDLTDLEALLSPAARPHLERWRS